MKKDRYCRARGGSAKTVSVSCSSCGEQVLYYQKDGTGNLLCCYLNRIISPEKYERLQYRRKTTKNEIPNLICKCGSLIGTPMVHKDGRFAFRLIRGKYQRKKKIKL